VIPRGGTFGFLGGGQLAWMMGLEARRMGYGVAVLDPDRTCPAAKIADVFVQAALDDVAGGQELAKASDVVTCDTEHVAAEVLERLEGRVEVQPRADIFRTVQDRWSERRFLTQAGLPQPAHLPVGSAQDLAAAARQASFPAILKSRRWGYDGRGQARVATARDLEGAWESIDRAPSVLEAVVPFDKEISVILARGREGQLAFHPIAENLHHEGILRMTRAPADIPPPLARQAQELGAEVASRLDHVGTLAVELFVASGALLVNEIAPRVHNSGHYTFGGCATSQFEQHLRAIGGLPLGDPGLLRPTVMVNVLGEAFMGGRDPMARTLAEWPEAKLFLYGKQLAKPGRKMAHFLVHADDVSAALERARTLSHALHATDVDGAERGCDSRPAP
jgi:5-(carboxyamino)imidazole ribonucleotide synthase